MSNSNTNNNTPSPPATPPPKPSAGQVLFSVLGALFGVQSSKVRQRDFEHGHPWWVYVSVGIVVTTLLVLGVLGLVSIILARGVK